MTKKRRNPVEPDNYLSNIDDPVYQQELSRYCSRHITSPVSLRRKLVRARYHLEKINSARVWETIPEDEKLVPHREESYYPPDERGKYAIEAVKELGAEAFRLPDGYRLALSKDGEDWAEEIVKGMEAWDKLGEVIIDVIENLQAMIRYARPNAKRRAAKRLSELLTSLIPETRGKRKRGLVINPTEVKRFYYQELFRIYHIKKTLLSRLGRRNEKVLTASLNFAMPAETIRKLWNLDDMDKPKARPISLKEMARILTARRFGLTQHRVSNILSS